MKPNEADEPAYPAELSNSGPQQGMTKREVFAMHAMASLVKLSPSCAAHDAVMYADALLAKLAEDKS